MSEGLELSEQAVMVEAGQHHPLVDMFDDIGLAEMTATPEDNQAFWDNMSFEQAEWLLFAANGVSRGVTAPEWGYAQSRTAIFDGTATTGYKMHYCPPSPQNARSLLREVWEASRGLEPSTAGTLDGLGLTIIHPLPYGNGRMARLISLLRSEGYDGSKVMRAKYNDILTPGSRFGLDFNSNRAQLDQTFTAHQTRLICKRYGYAGSVPIAVDFGTKADGAILDQIAATLPEIDQAIDHLREVYFSVPLLTEVVLKKGLDLTDYMDAKGALSLSRIFACLSPRDCKEVVAASEELKTSYVRSIIKCLAEGDESIYGSPDAIVERYKFGVPAQEMYASLLAGGLATAMAEAAKAMIRQAQDDQSPTSDNEGSNNDASSI